MHTETCKGCHMCETKAVSLIKELEQGTGAIIINNILNQDMQREKSGWFHVGMKTLVDQWEGKTGDFMGVGKDTLL